MAFLPQYFLSNIKAKDSLAKPCRFQVVLPIPTYINNFISRSFMEQLMNFPNSFIADVTNFVTDAGSENSISADPTISRYLALQCESTELPGRTLMTADAKIYGPTYKVPYQTQYNDINFTFLCTNEFYERKLFDRWLEAIMPSDTNNLRYARGENTRYMTNIKIIQYDDFVSQIYAIELVDAFPIGVAAQPLSWGDENFHRLTVQFAYQKYKVIYQGNTDIVAAAIEIFGAKAAKWFDQQTGKITQPLGPLFNDVQKAAN